MKPVILFDVNETLLDLTALDPLFMRLFGDRQSKSAWFARLLHQSLVATLVGRYHDFGSIAQLALRQVANDWSVTLDSADEASIVAQMGQLPAHPDVRPALTTLQAAGFRLATLTNSTPSLLAAQMAYSELSPFFEQLLTVADVRQFKPAPATYRAAAARLGVSPSEVCLVAAHDWDTAGAVQAGCIALFVGRPGAAYSPLLPKATYEATDLVAAAHTVMATWPLPK